VRRVLHVAVVWSVLAASASSVLAQPAAQPVPEPEVTAAPIPIPVPVPRAAAPDAPVAMPDKPVAPVPVAHTASATEVVKAILGLLVILVLAYLAGHPRVQEIEEMLGISQVVTAGFPFVLLGLIATTPESTSCPTRSSTRYGRPCRSGSAGSASPSASASTPAGSRACRAGSPPPCS
jgi:hypothetical protein